MTLRSSNSRKLCALSKEACHEAAHVAFILVTDRASESSIYWTCSVVEYLPRIWYMVFQAQKFDPVRVLG